MSMFRQLSQLPNDIDYRLGEKIDPTKPKIDSADLKREAWRKVFERLDDLRLAFNKLAHAFDGGVVQAKHLGNLFEEMEAAANGMAGLPYRGKTVQLEIITATNQSSSPLVSSTVIDPPITLKAGEDLAMTGVIKIPNDIAKRMLDVNPPYRARTPVVEDSNSMGAWTDGVHTLMGGWKGQPKVPALSDGESAVVNVINADRGKLVSIGLTNPAAEKPAVEDDSRARSKMCDALVALKDATSAKYTKRFIGLCTGHDRVFEIEPGQRAAVTFTAKQALLTGNELRMFVHRMHTWAIQSNYMREHDRQVAHLQSRHPTESVRVLWLLRVFHMRMKFGSVIETI